MSNISGYTHVITSKKARRRMPKLIKLPLIIIAGFLALLVTIGIVLAVIDAARGAMPTHGAQGAAQDCLTLAHRDGFAPEVCEPIEKGVDPQVADWNDGFATAKQDDCQQHFADACNWLATTKH